METKTNDLWVFIETTADGRAKSVGIELLRPGRALADRQGGALVAVVIGCDAAQAVRDAAHRGADRVLVADAPAYRRYDTDAYAAALTALAQTYAPAAILIGATPNGRDMAPRVSCRLRTGLTADCTALSIDEESGDVCWTRPAFGGNLMAVIRCPERRPQLGTVRPGVFKKPDAGEETAQIVRVKLPAAPPRRVRLIETLEEAAGEIVELETADIIVAGGRGAGGPSGFQPLRELAGALGAALGCSRAAVDAGWISHAHQVGQTGKTVAPRLYIACGISGAIQHLAGMSAADTIVAINKDANAPIFGAATYGVVGNLFEVVPALTAAIRQRKSGRD